MRQADQERAGAKRCYPNDLWPAPEHSSRLSANRRLQVSLPSHPFCNSSMNKMRALCGLSMTPLSLDRGSTAIRAALSRLCGPSKSEEDALHWAPIRITGLLDLTVQLRLAMMPVHPGLITVSSKACSQPVTPRVA